MRTILVTGRLGFIGSNFIRYMLSLNQDFKIINLDKITYAGNPKNLEDVIEKHPREYKFYKGDIYNFKLLDRIYNKENVDFIINFAAETHVDRSIANPNIFITTNIVGTQTLLNISKKNDIKRYIQISTDEVYGSLDFNDLAFTEESTLSPNSPYSASKASADLLVNSYFKTYNLPVCITRCSNNYGPFQFPEKLIPLMINNALNGKELPIYGEGLNIRDWIHVKDHCEAILKVLLEGEIGQTYNIGGDSELSNIKLVKKLLKIIEKSESLIKFVKDRPGHDLRYAINHEKISKELNWTPKISFEKGLKSTIQWYQDNQEWLRNVLNKNYLSYYEKNYQKR